jgi:hypothetical protein
MKEGRLVGKRWTAADERRLREMLEAGKTAVEISRKLRRTIRAIYARLQRIWARPLLLVRSKSSYPVRRNERKAR